MTSVVEATLFAYQGFVPDVVPLLFGVFIEVLWVGCGEEHGYIFLSGRMVDLRSPPTSLTEPREPPKFPRGLVKSVHSLSLGFYVLVVDPTWIS